MFADEEVHLRVNVFVRDLSRLHERLSHALRRDMLEKIIETLLTTPSTIYR